MTKIKSGPEVRLSVDGEIISLTAPYHANLLTLAHQNGGKWSAQKKLWHFSRFVAEGHDTLTSLKRSLIELFGDCCVEGEPRRSHTIRLSFFQLTRLCDYDKRMIAFGRVLLLREGRDGDIKAHPDCILIEPKVARRGSRAHPVVGLEPSVMMMIRDVSDEALARAEHLLDEKIEIVESSHEPQKSTIVADHALAHIKVDVSLEREIVAALPPSRHKIQGEDLVEVMVRYEAGATLFDLAESFNTSISTIWSALSRVGVKLRTPGPSPAYGVEKAVQVNFAVSPEQYDLLVEGAMAHNMPLASYVKHKLGIE